MREKFLHVEKQKQIVYNSSGNEICQPYNGVTNVVFSTTPYLTPNWASKPIGLLPILTIP